MNKGIAGFLNKNIIVKVNNGSYSGTLSYIGEKYISLSNLHPNSNLGGKEKGDMIINIKQIVCVYESSK